MEKPVEWKLWSVNEIVSSLPRLITMVETSLEVFLEAHREKNRAAVESLRESPPTAADIREGSRSSELIALGYALDSLGNKITKNGNIEESLRLFQSAHELFRSGNPSLHPTKPMRQALNDALRALLLHEIAAIKAGESDAGLILDEINAFVVSAWGYVPPQLAMSINEIMLTNLENVRAADEEDTTFHERFVRDNIETVLAMEVPTRLEKIQDRWREIGEHVAPTATRTAVRALRRAQNLSSLLPHFVWDQIQQALEQGNVKALTRALAQVEDDLETNLRLRLTAKPEYREPGSEIRYRGNPDRFFIEARDLLLRQSPDALRKFENIHYHKNNDPLAKEWYAYALSRFGRATDIYDIIQLLEDAIKAPSYRPEYGWTARWNLACALRRLPPRADEALDELLPVLENDDHSNEVFELCLLWALDQEREDVLPTLLLKSSYYEAHLLAALNHIEAHPDGDGSDLRDHFRRLNRILRDPDHVFPDPKERLEFDELDRLTRDFIETSLVVAGIEWFRQRISYINERRNWKNWECAAKLNERAGDLQAAWRCFRSQWSLTSRNNSLPPPRKTPVLRSLMYWAERNGFEEDALRLLRQDWQNTSLTDADVRLLELRLKKGSATDDPGTVTPSPDVRNSQRDIQPDLPVAPAGAPRPLTPAEAEHIIQRVAGSFAGVSSPDTLADKAEDAMNLIAAVAAKHPEIASSIVIPLRVVINLAMAFRAGVNDQQAQELAKQMREQLAPLQRQRQDLPYEITGLAQACERVIQNMAMRVKVVPEIIISPLESLKVMLDRPSLGETYQTRIFIRLTNPGTEEMRDINVAFTSPSPHLRFLEGSVTMAGIGPGEKSIVEGPLEVSYGVEDGVEIRIHASYKSGGVARSTHYLGHVPVRPIDSDIPFTQRYMTGSPVTLERIDLFHGRDKELKDLVATFAGGRLLRLYFVNGIRRVGKSTLMNQVSGRCGHDILPLLLNMQEALGDSNMSTVQLVRQLIRKTIEQVQDMRDLPPVSLAVPGLEAFELDPPWVVFEDFLENLRRQTQRHSILICFDEVQYLVNRIANPDDPINDAFLSWMRGKVQARSNILLICTGSEPYSVMRKRFEHTLWGNMEAYNISFVEKSAMEKIATLPVKPDGVIWLPEAIDRLWDMTEGHPWLTQALAEKVAERLNIERRRQVGPDDVDRAVDLAMLDERYSGLWWNEEEGQVTATHRQVAFLILQHQPGSRLGLPESQLAEICQKSGIRTVGKYLDEMRVLEVLTDAKQGNDPHWRIKGGFLEKYLTTLMYRAAQGDSLKQSSTLNQPLALMLDWENIKISLLDLLNEMPMSQSQSIRPRLAGTELAMRLLDAASHHGMPRQKWAVANWDRPTFAGDQAALRRARYMPDMSGEDKDDASDHVLREKIHYVLREQPEISTYIIGTGDADFGEVIKTLQEKGKHVVLWATKKAINDVYKHYLTGPDRIQIEWLEDIIFEKESTG